MSTVVVSTPTVTVDGTATTASVPVTSSSVTFDASTDTPTVASTATTVTVDGGASSAAVTVASASVTITADAGTSARGVKYLSTYSGTDPTGTSDCATAVQAAVDAWASANVIVVDGTFACSSAINLPSGVILEAARHQVDGFTFDWQLASVANYFLGNDTTDGTVTGIKLRGLKITGAGDGTPWGPNGVSGAPVNGVKLTSVYDCEVVGCYFYRVTGISLNYSGRDIRITDNVFEEGGRDGSTGYWRSELGLQNITVANNRYHLLGDDCIAIWADSTSQTNGTAATVTTAAGDSTVTGTGTSWVAGDVGSRIAIPGAEIGSAMYEGVITAVTDSTHVEVLPEVRLTVTSVGATYGYDRPANVTITGNEIVQDTTIHTHGGNRGILVGGGENVTVSGNVVKGTHGNGIRVTHAPNDTNILSRGVTVDGCAVYDAGQYAGSSGSYTGRRDGLELDGTIGCRIVGGSVINSYGRGIYVADSIDPVIEGVLVEDNGTASTDYGIELWGSGSGSNLVVNPQVIGCTVRRNQGGGLRFFNTQYGSVIGGQFISNGQAGAQDADASGIICTGATGWQVIGATVRDYATGTRTQWGGIRVTNSGGSPVLQLVGCHIEGNGSNQLIVSNTSAVVMRRGNLVTSATDADSYDMLPGGLVIATGSGSPESSVTAPVGSLYLRTDGSTSTTLYVKTSGTGNTGWTAK